MIVGLLQVPALASFVVAPPSLRLADALVLTAALGLAAAGGVAAPTLALGHREPTPWPGLIVAGGVAVIVGRTLPSTTTSASGWTAVVGGSPGTVAHTVVSVATLLAAVVLAVRLPVAAGVGAAAVLAVHGLGAASPLLFNAAGGMPSTSAPLPALLGGVAAAVWVVVVRRGHRVS